MSEEIESINLGQSIASGIQDICLVTKEVLEMEEHNHDLVMAIKDGSAAIFDSETFEIKRPIKATYLSKTLRETDAIFQNCVSGTEHIILIDVRTTFQISAERLPNMSNVPKSPRMVAIVFEFSRVYFCAVLARHRSSV